jgi:hypothetical protein
MTVAQAARFVTIVQGVTVVQNLTVVTVVIGKRFRPGDVARDWGPLGVDPLCRSFFVVLLVLVFSEHLDANCKPVNTACWLLMLVA